jgi:hypothetical protein
MASGTAASISAEEFDETDWVAESRRSNKLLDRRNFFRLILMDELARELRRNVNSGIRQAGRLLLRDNIPDFEMLAVARTVRAYHGTSHHRHALVDIFVTCDECMRDETIGVCLRCFLRQNRQGHRAIVRQMSAACKYGDSNAVRPSCFCPDDPGYRICPDVDFLTPQICSQYESVFAVVLDFVAEKFPAQDACLCLRWLANFKQWGDPYERLVVNALVNGQLHGLAVGAVRTSPGGRQEMIQFLFNMINDAKLSVWIADWLYMLIPEMTELMIISIPGGLEILSPYMDLYSLVRDVYCRAEVASHVALNDDFVKTILDCSLSCLVAI